MVLGRAAARVVLLILVAAGTTACSNRSPTTPTSTPPPASCAYSISGAPSDTLAASASELTLSIATPANCSWTVASSAAFVTIVGANTGIGNGSVKLAVAANTGAARQAGVTVGGQTISISQQSGAPQSCSYGVNPADSAAPQAGGDISFEVTAGANCDWSATTADAFLTVKGNATGSGNGTVVLTAATNNGDARTGRATIAGSTVTVNQAGKTSCAFSVSPTSISAPATASLVVVTITVTAGSDCSWNAASTSTFALFTGRTFGNGNGSVTLAIADNFDAARSAQVTVAGQIVTVNQAAGVPGEPVAILSFQSDPGDSVGMGTTRSYTLHGSEFLLTSASGPGRMTFRMVANPFWTLNLATTGGALSPGLYERTGRFGFQAPSQPGLDFNGDGNACNVSTGRFLIGQSGFAPDGSLRRFQARFEQQCEWFSTALRGEIWIDMTGALPSAPTPAFPPGDGQMSLVTLQSEPGDPVLNGTSKTLTVASARFHAGVMTSRPTVNITVGNLPGSPFFQHSLDFQAPSGTQLLPGTYTVSGTAYPFQPAGVPGLSFSGPLMCGNVSGQFTVLDVVYGPKGEVYRFHATFEQRCNGSAATLRGELWIFSDPWR